MAGLAIYLFALISAVSCIPLGQTTVCETTQNYPLPSQLFSGLIPPPSTTVCESSPNVLPMLPFPGLGALGYPLPFPFGIGLGVSLGQPSAGFEITNNPSLSYPFPGLGSLPVPKLSTVSSVCETTPSCPGTGRVYPGSSTTVCDNVANLLRQYVYPCGVNAGPNVDSLHGLGLQLGRPFL